MTKIKDELIELSEEIAKWHEATFPDVTEESQILKLQEEIKEFENSEDHDIEELADVFIVCSSLIHRWNNLIGNGVALMLFPLDKTVNDLKELKSAVLLKMLTNVERKWVKQENGTYHHVK
jgi:predicted house-cleaning noncanonical NTP pyrophosphatase (MazG superfamily)